MSEQEYPDVLVQADPDEDARKEGDYENMDEFREGYAKVYGEDAWDPEKVVAVVEFEHVGRERPTEEEEMVA